MLLGLLVAWIALACGVGVDPRIADEFHERLAPRDRGWTRVPCPDRAVKVERVRGLVPMALELRARIREYTTPATPQLLERLMAFPMLGRADDYRCVVQDFTRIDLKTEPDFEDARGLVGNLYMLKGSHLIEHDRADEGWAHVVDGLTLYQAPVGPGVDEHLGMQDMLRWVNDLLDTHPPPPSTITALVEALDAAFVSQPVICAALRHDLLTLAVIGFRVHFGQREREAMARRFGLDFAMRTWRTPQKPGSLDRSVWNELREIYDGMISGCTRRPLGRSIQRAADPFVRLDMLHPPTAILARVIGNQINRAALLSDVRITLLARLRGRQLRHTLGRDPTTAELALSFGRRPENPWDGRGYNFIVGGGVVTVVRGPYRHNTTIGPTIEPGKPTSYPQLPPAAVHGLPRQ